MLPPDLQSPESRSPITFSKVLTVEGRDTFEFFKALLRSLDLLNTVEIRNFGGVTDLTERLELLTITPGFERVTALGIVRDAETDAGRAFQSVCNSLTQVGFPVPPQPMVSTEGRPKVSVFLLPDSVSPGTLETLCLRSVAKDPAMACIEEYFQCVVRQGLPLPGNMLKAQVHTFLASRPRPYLMLGQGAHEGYWPWDNPAFDPLKRFLRAL